MPTMRAVQVSSAGGAFELVKREVPEPQHGHVRVKVEACGICHSDILVKEGHWPGIAYPRIPGHEVAGVIDKTGEGVAGWKKGQRVGVGWHGGHCFQCESCRRGDFITCQNAKITGISYDGGYAEYMVAPQDALARIPDDLTAIDAAPLLCAGITTYNALRNSGARAGDLVAISGVGGLGHLGIQFSNRLGFRTVAISQGAEKEAPARKLGADAYIDATAVDPATALAGMGGARVILATAPNSKLISRLVNGLNAGGKLLIVAASAEPVEVTPLQLIGGRKSLQGWPSGDAKDSEDTLNFSALRGVRPVIETFPLEKAEEAYQRMIANKARFRVVLQIAR